MASSGSLHLIAFLDERCSLARQGLLSQTDGSLAADCSFYALKNPIVSILTFWRSLIFQDFSFQQRTFSKIHVRWIGFPNFLRIDDVGRMFSVLESMGGGSGRC